MIDLVSINIYPCNMSRIHHVCDMLSFPTLNGQITLTAGDFVMISFLKEGFLQFYRDNIIFKTYFITGGEIYTSNNNIYVVTKDEVLDLDNITMNKVEEIIADIMGKIITLKDYIENESDFQQYLQISHLKYFQDKLKRYQVLEKHLLKEEKHKLKK